MAKWNRVSGRVRVQLSYDDRADVYRAKVCAPKAGCQKVTVGLPKKRMTRGVDHPIEISSAARSAISFAKQDISDEANWGDSGPIVKKPRSKRRAGR